MRIRRFLAFVVVAGAAASPLRAQNAVVPHTAEPFLSALEGTWTMRGQVRGEPVVYALRASRTLAGRFLELHMRDVASPPAYEARVFIGADTAATRVVVHWLDSFGAAFSVPHGRGRVSGDTLRFDIAYSDGTFRDTIIRHRGKDSWQLTIEASDGRGGWRSFAAYEVRRAPAR